MQRAAAEQLKLRAEQDAEHDDADAEGGAVVVQHSFFYVPRRA